VEGKSPAVKHDRLNISFQASFREQSAYLFRRRDVRVRAPVPAKRRLDGRGRSQGPALSIINDLCIDVLTRKMDA
jgi:hypothetical protein